MAGIIIGFFQMALYCAVIIFVAFLFVWGLKYFLSVDLDANVYKWGKIVVGLLCFIAFLIWLFSVLGLGGGLQTYFRIR
jgi:predicted small integral membrane protein